MMQIAGTEVLSQSYRITDVGYSSVTRDPCAIPDHVTRLGMQQLV